MTDDALTSAEQAAKTDTLLVAVDDTPAALAGARFAVELARTAGLRVCAVAVIPKPPAAPHPPLQPQRESAPQPQRTAQNVLRYVETVANREAVPVECVVRTGEPALCVLDQAQVVGARIIVVGRSGRAGPGEPYVGSQTRHVLEFADCPVLVVPPPTVGATAALAHPFAGEQEYR